MNKLEELEKLADAATDKEMPKCWHSWEVMADDGYSVDDAKFIAAATPQTIKKLFSRQRKLEALCRMQNRDLVRYRHETPLGNQPYMLAGEADRTIAAFDKFQKGEE